VRFFNEVETQLKPEVGAWHSVKDFAAKAAEHAARLAAVFEVFQDVKATEISAESISAAIKIVRWHLAQFDQHLGKGASELRIHQSAEALLKWLQNKANTPFGACHHYTRRDLLQLGPRAIRNAASLDLAIEALLRDKKIVCENTKRGLCVRLSVDISANFVNSPGDSFLNNTITGFSPFGNGFDGNRGLLPSDVNRVVQVSYIDK
jgi:hypothetical protein